LYLTVALGSRGDAVRAVQDQANFRNLKNGHTLDVDGIFGPLTRAWVIRFQQEVASSDKSFPVDGIVGPLTWPPLVGGMYSL
jgi:peptidoglycan hydrolase-like protein with peptidoglycan-binding domain